MLRFGALLCALFASTALAQNEVRVDFHIKAGTDGNDWNTEAEPVVIKAGQRLVIHNDDTRVHQLHTFGRPCSHGSSIPAGTIDDHCVIYAGSELGLWTLYDHRTLAKFYLSIVE